MSDKEEVIKQVEMQLAVQIAEAEEMEKRANKMHVKMVSLSSLIFSALNDAGMHGLADHVKKEISNV